MGAPFNQNPVRNVKPLEVCHCETGCGIVAHPWLKGICFTHVDDKTLSQAVSSRSPFATRYDTPLPISKPVRALRENCLDSAPIVSL